MTIAKQQDMEVLGVDLFLSVLVKDRPLHVPQVMLNACLTFSWLDKSFRPEASGTIRAEIDLMSARIGAGWEMTGREE
jgi:hypothetical protein